MSPVGNGKIISAQVFCGPDVDFGNGPRLFIDNFGTNYELIQTYKEYLEDPEYLKSWFNYGFDRHIFYNHDIDVKGFGGDSMQMARLVDPSRGPKSYSLSNLTKFYEKEIQEMKRGIVNKIKNMDNCSEIQKRTLEIYERKFIKEDMKVNMKKIFAKRKVLKNGERGKTFEVIDIIFIYNLDA